MSPRTIEKHTLASALAGSIILLAAILMLTSSWDDSPAYDEVEHITAGYYYVTEHNYRLNPFHPPLFKDLAGMGALMARPKPGMTGDQVWKATRDELTYSFFWGQPDAQSMLRCARLPLILVAVFFLIYFFIRLRREFGARVSLIGLTLLAMSPTYLAHSRFVGNDGAVTACFFVCICAFTDYLRKPDRINLLKTGAFTGVALLTKFSAVLLFPLYLVIGVIARLLGEGKMATPRLLGHALMVVAISGSMVWLGYEANMINLPASFQHRYNENTFAPGLRADPRVQLIFATQNIELLRPFSWYMTGLFAQTLRLFPSEQGEIGCRMTGYLMGSLYSGGSPAFYPALILTKEPLGFIVLGAIALPYLLLSPLSTLVREKSFKSAFRREDLLVYSAICFVAVYFGIALSSHLNIGIRHILPVFPFTYMLVAVGLVKLYDKLKQPMPAGAVSMVAAACLAFGVLSSVACYPGYLAYFNELAGGKQAGRHIAIDSNFDWGVDLYRLKQFVEKNDIKTIYVFYFGSGSPEYYLGGRYRAFPDRILPPGQYLAVSAQFLEEAGAFSTAEQKPTKMDVGVHRPGQLSKDVLRWMVSREPIAVIGDSIFILAT